MNRDNAGPNREYSAGGVITRGDKVLVIQVENLKGETVWTFPKGHLEQGETSQAAALREVEEETGWSCRIVRKLDPVHYFFVRDGRRVAKKVQWFWMEPVEKRGEPDAKEVLEARWVGWEKAEELTRYPTDKKLIEEVRALASEKPAA